MTNLLLSEISDIRTRGNSLELSCLDAATVRFTGEVGEICCRMQKRLKSPLDAEEQGE